jgi:hypothetical protein
LKHGEVVAQEMVNVTVTDVITLKVQAAAIIMLFKLILHLDANILYAPAAVETAAVLSALDVLVALAMLLVII